MKSSNLFIHAQLEINKRLFDEIRLSIELGACRLEREKETEFNVVATFDQTILKIVITKAVLFSLYIVRRDQSSAHAQLRHKLLHSLLK